MPILSAIASMLESAAAVLRRAGETSTVEAMKAPVRAVVQRIAPEQHPIGFWRCTHSTFDDFLPGHAYRCRRSENTGCIRIAPYEGSFWSPYWQPHDQRFCYADKDLQFTYLGTKLPDGEKIDERTHEQRVTERFRTNRLAKAA